MGRAEGVGMNLTAHFTLKELTSSSYALRRGIDNSAPDDILDKLYDTAAGMERIRTVLDVPITITSGYRCPKLNTAIGGSKTSQHMQGEAVDFKAPAFGTVLDACRAILDAGSFVEFDQLINEGGQWIHVSFSDNPRGDVLTAHFENGRVRYTRGL
jgi:hypothetical protein